MNRIWPAAVLVLTLFSQDCLLAEEAVDRSAVDALVTPLLKNREVVGLVIGVIHDRKQSIFSYGSISSTKTVPPNGKTIFEAGSITKPFTGLLLARLVQQGKVALDDPISKYLPEDSKLPRWGKRDIQLLDLATHTSGLPKIPTNLFPSDPSNLYADYTGDDLIAYLRLESRGNLIRSLAAGRTDHQSYRYSNLGVGLLGYLLERAEGKVFDQLLVENVCAPLGLNDTRIQLTAEQRKRLADGHDSLGRPATAWEFDCLAGCAALRTTCEDMLKFLSILIEPGNPAMTSAIETSLKPRRPIDADTSVGLCWEIENGPEVVHKNGQTGGFNAIVLLRRKSRFGVVVLANTRNEIIERIAPRVLHIAVGAPVSPIPIERHVPLDSRLLEACVGNYRAGELLTAEVVKVRDALVIKPNDVLEYPVYPKSEKEFFAKHNSQIHVSFIRRDDGTVDEFIYRDDEAGISLRYSRVVEP